jgi:hypothetical protein
MTKCISYLPMQISGAAQKIRTMDNSNKTQTAASHHEEPIVVNRLPKLPLLLGKAAFKTGFYNLGDDLPRLSIDVSPFNLCGENLKRYRQVCGFQSQQVPITYFFVVAFPLFIRLMLDKRFPLRPMGLVHLRNHIDVRQAIDASSPISIKATVGTSELSAKGLEWDIETLVQSRGEIVWTAKSTFLHRCRTGISRQVTKPTQPSGQIEQWSLPADTGRRYAKVSGDYNPIHLSDISARLLGFKRAIAHGMWSKARCLAALESQLPSAGYQINTSFHKPVFLPSSVRFSSHREADEQKFYLFNGAGDLMHLQGTILKDKRYAQF